MGLGIFKRFFKAKPTVKKRLGMKYGAKPTFYPKYGLRAPRPPEADFETQKQQGIEIPAEIPDDFSGTATKISTSKGKGKREIVSFTYPLIPKKPKVGEFVYAYAKIYFDKDLNKYIYQVFEPPLTPNIKGLI